MLLALTSSGDATASYLLPLLEDVGLQAVRVDTDSVVAEAKLSYSAGIPVLCLGTRSIRADAITAVWYRRPERLADPRFDNSPEGKYTLAEWTECLEGFFGHIPEQQWINHPARNALAGHKIEQLTTASAIGFRVPDTIVTQNADEFKAFQAKHGKVVVKPMATGYIERTGEESDSLIYTNAVRSADLCRADEVAVCPTLFQQCIDKACDVRITIIDDEMHAIALFASDDGVHQRCDIRRNNMVDVRYEVIEPPCDVKSNLLNLMRHYRLRFGAIDMVVSTAGDWYFLEINPNGQWAWLDLCADAKIGMSFIRSFSSAPK